MLLEKNQKLPSCCHLLYLADCYPLPLVGQAEAPLYWAMLTIQQFNLLKPALLVPCAPITISILLIIHPSSFFSLLATLASLRTPRPMDTAHHRPSLPPFMRYY